MVSSPTVAQPDRGLPQLPEVVEAEEQPAVPVAAPEAETETIKPAALPESIAVPPTLMGMQSEAVGEPFKQEDPPFAPPSTTQQDPPFVPPPPPSSKAEDPPFVPPTESNSSKPEDLPFIPPIDDDVPLTAQLGSGPNSPLTDSLNRRGSGRSDSGVAAPLARSSRVNPRGPRPLSEAGSGKVASMAKRFSVQRNPE